MSYTPDQNWINILNRLDPNQSNQSIKQESQVEDTIPEPILKIDMISYLPSYSKDHYLEVELNERDSTQYHRLMILNKEFLCYSDTSTLIKIVSLMNLELIEPMDFHKNSVFDLGSFESEKSGIFKKEKFNVFSSTDLDGKIAVWIAWLEENYEKINQRIVMLSSSDDKTPKITKFKTKNQFLSFGGKEISIFWIKEENFEISGNENKENLNPEKFIIKILENEIKMAEFSLKNDIVFVGLDSNVIQILNGELLDKIREFNPYNNDPDSFLQNLLSYRNLEQITEKNTEIINENFALKDFFLTISQKLEIKVWDISEFDSNKNEYLCIQCHKVFSEEIINDIKDLKMLWEFDYSKNFLFIITQIKEENVLHIFHVDKLFYNYSEKLQLQKKETKFFNYCKEYKLHNRPIINMSIINIPKDDLKLYFNTDVKSSYIASLINENLMKMEENQENNNEGICDSKTMFAIFCLYDPCFNISLVLSDEAYPIYLIDDLNKFEEKNERVRTHPPDLPSIIKNLAHLQNTDKKIENEHLIEQEQDHEQEEKKIEMNIIITNDPFMDLEKEKFFSSYEKSLEKSLEKKQENIIDNIENRYNIDSIENRDSIDNKDNRDNRENKDDRDNRDNRENKDNRNIRDNNNRDNRDNKDNRDIRDNRDNRDNKEMKDNRDNRDNRDHRDNKEIKDNRDNKEMKDNRDNNANRGENKDNKDNRGNRNNRDNRENSNIITTNSQNNSKYGNNQRREKDRDKEDFFGYKEKNKGNNKTKKSKRAPKHFPGEYDYIPKLIPENYQLNTTEVKFVENISNSENLKKIEPQKSIEIEVKKEEIPIPPNPPINLIPENLVPIDPVPVLEKIEEKDKFLEIEEKIEVLLNKKFEKFEQTFFEKLAKEKLLVAPVPVQASVEINQNQMSKVFSEQFEKVVTPCFEKYLIKMFEQVNNTFERGQRFFIERLSLEQIKSQNIKDSLNEVMKIFMQVSGAISDNIANNQRHFGKYEGIFTEKQNQINKLIDGINEIIKKEGELQERMDNIQTQYQDMMRSFKNMNEENNTSNNNNNTNQKKQELINKTEIEEKIMLNNEANKKKEELENYQEYMNKILKLQELALNQKNMENQFANQMPNFNPYNLLISPNQYQSQQIPQIPNNPQTNYYPYSYPIPPPPPTNPNTNPNPNPNLNANPYSYQPFQYTNTNSNSNISNLNNIQNFQNPYLISKYLNEENNQKNQTFEELFKKKMDSGNLNNNQNNNSILFGNNEKNMQKNSGLSNFLMMPPYKDK